MLRSRRSSVAVLAGVALLAAGVPFAAATLRSRARPVRRLKAAFLSARLLSDDGVELQRQTSDCGPTALRRVLALHDPPLPLDERMPSTTMAGWTLAQVVAASRQAGVVASVVKAPPARIATIDLPVIALLGTHYVVIEKRSGAAEFVVFDPDLGRMKAGSEYLCRDWTGFVVTFPGFHQRAGSPSAAAPERHRSGNRSKPLR